MGAILMTNARPTAASPSIPCHRGGAVCAGVEPEKLHRLDAIATKINLKPQQNVFFEGDPAEVYIDHIKPGLEETVMHEIARRVRNRRPRALNRGQVLEL